LCEGPFCGAVGIRNEKCCLARAETGEDDSIGCATRIRGTRERKNTKEQGQGTRHRTLRTEYFEKEVALQQYHRGAAAKRDGAILVWLPCTVFHTSH
jgi:hypothetical protein